MMQSLQQLNGKGEIVRKFNRADRIYLSELKLISSWIQQPGERWEKLTLRCTFSKLTSIYIWPSPHLHWDSLPFAHCWS